MCHLCIIIGDHKGTSLHLRLVYVVPNWERLPRNVTVSSQLSNGVCFPGEPPYHGLAMVDLSGQLSLSLSLVKEGFSLGNLRKSSEPITAVRQAT
jgi:hypothetical protein